MQDYDESFFRAKANKRAGITWLALILIATVYYGIKTKSGEITKGYFTACMIVGWVTYNSSAAFVMLWQRLAVQK